MKSENKETKVIVLIGLIIIVCFIIYDMSFFDVNQLMPGTDNEVLNEQTDVSSEQENSNDINNSLNISNTNISSYSGMKISSNISNIINSSYSGMKINSNISNISNSLNSSCNIQATGTDFLFFTIGNQNIGDQYNLKTGENITLKANRSHNNISSVETVSWSSSNTSVATVSNGTVTTKKGGNATITAKSKDGLTTSIKINVYSAYTASIEKISSSTNTLSGLTENLKIHVTDQNNNNITSGLTYQWYFNGQKISNATSSEYSISKYGTYKAMVYKNGTLIAQNTYIPSAAEVNYEIDTSKDTKFVFVNNPESINDGAMVDNGKIIYKTTFNKNIELYFEHNRSTSTPFYYGIRIYNPTDKIVDLYINKSGTSACYNGCNYYDQTWEEYFSGNVTYRLGETAKKEKYTMTPGQYLYFWLVPDESMLGKTKFVVTISNYQYEPYNDYLTNSYSPIDSSWGWAFDGVLNLSAKISDENYLSSVGGNLEVSNIAVSKDFYKAANKDKINSTSTLASKMDSQLLTGEYAGQPLVTNNIKFVIDNTTPKGNLSTYYSTTTDSSSKNLVSGWITNISGNNTSSMAYQREMIPLSGYNANGSKYTVAPFSSIVTANYTVKYLENITITNNSSKSRNVAFYVNTSSGVTDSPADTTLVSFVTNSSQSIVRSSYKTNEVTIYPNATFDIFPTRTNVKVWSATIPAGKTITVPSIVLMGGMSYGTLTKFVCVDNICYDAFYKKEFSW